MKTRAAFALLLAGCTREPARPQLDAAPATAAPPVLLLADASLPALSTGYELYAYRDEQTLMFTLVSWSDRVKARELLTESRPDYRDGELVRVHGSGLSELRSMLTRVPSRSSVIFESDPRLPALSDAQQSEVLSLLLERSATGTDAGTGAATCLKSGGRIDASYCCMSSPAFPDTCQTGACGCAPESSRLIPYCVCPEAHCFTPNKGCVTRR